MSWSLLLAPAAFLGSMWVMVEGAEKLTEGLLRTSAAFGVSAFTLGYLFNGIDLENLAVGIVGALQGLPGISMGTVIGSGIFLLTLAVGATAVLTPLTAKTPRRLIVMTLLSPLPLAALALDRTLSRVDGAILLALAVALIGYVLRTARTHPLYQAKAKKLKKAEADGRPRWWGIALMAGGTIAIVIGAELFNWSVKQVLASFALDGTTFGMVVVAAVVSFEEVPRMLAPARRGHADVAVGNILGTVLFFVLFNAGVIALIQPLALEASVLGFYWPALMVTLLLISLFLWRGHVSRAAGLLLLGCYGLYVVLAIRVGLRLL